MSVTPNNLTFIGSASMPDGDGTTTGGAPNFAAIVNFSDISPSGTLTYYTSSASDTAATIQVYGRDGTGVIQNETKTAAQAGTAGSQAFERLLKGLAGGTTAVGDLAALSTTAVVTGTAPGAANTSGNVPPYLQLQAGQGASVALGQIIRITNNTPAGAQYHMRRIVQINPANLGGDFVAVNRDWTTVPTSATTYTVSEGMLFDILPNQVTQNRRPFYNAAADIAGGTNRTYFEKLFAVNNNTATAATVASILKQADLNTGSASIVVGAAGATSGATVIPTASTTGVAVGQQAVGTNIAPGSTVLSFVANTSVTLSIPTTGAIAAAATISLYAASSVAIVVGAAGVGSGGTSVPTASTSGVANGMLVTGPGIAAGTTVASFVANTSITLSAATTGAISAAATLNLYGAWVDFALTAALDDSGTVAARQTAPASGIGSWSAGPAPASIAVPSPQNLPNGAAPNTAGTQGLWLRLSLIAGQAPFKGSFVVRSVGQTT
ncbi:MAG TPA: hypothetical protein VNE67_09085 [Acetobacteraceae bacterium]|nr:hypothetical protein [Acetobacteraceae bacterium]